jgi:uncharacterized glyoxalase superfamily protein PhnB
MAIGGASFWVSSGGAGGPRFSPRAIGSATGRTLLVADDPDAMFGQAAAAGASAAAEMAEEHGWRLGRIVDPFPRVGDRPTARSLAAPLTADSLLDPWSSPVEP